MVFKNFELMLFLRILIVFFTLSTLAILIVNPSYYTTSFLLLVVVVFQISDIVYFINRTNSRLTQFLDAFQYADYTQQFNDAGAGSGFDQLSVTLSNILTRFQIMVSEQKEKEHYLKALLEHVPVPLISVRANNNIILHNSSARRLFGSSFIDKRSGINSVQEQLISKISLLKPGEQSLIKINNDGIEQSLTVAITEFILANHTERLISLQNIQSELEITQSQAWQDLVRVLTHEIVNSITPVASLAKTSVEMVDGISRNIDLPCTLNNELHDIRNAVNTVARRSDGLMAFVQSYRRLTQLPSPKKKKLRIADLLIETSRLATINWDKKNIHCELRMQCKELEAYIDSDMLAQVLINLLQNAEQALKQTDNARVTITCKLNHQGRVMIEVSDNGPGIPKDIEKNIFVPFFTTKQNGTGVGLALSRQLLIAQGGSISISRKHNSGATFVLTL